MNAIAHMSYAFLLFAVAFVLIFGTIPTGGPCILAMIGGIFPDIDSIFWVIKRGKARTTTTTQFQHHLHYPTHFPVTYIPVALWVVIAIFVDIYPVDFFALALGIYTHLACDSMTAGDGINWGAPWSRKFINLFATTTDGYHGMYWSARYKKTIFFKAGIVAAIGSMALLAWFAFASGFDVSWYVIGISVLAIVIVISFIPIDSRYEQEPPEGRYADYRAKPEYYARLSPAMKQRIAAWKKSHGQASAGDLP